MKLSDFAASADAADRESLVRTAMGFNPPKTEYPRKTVHRLVSEQAARRPDAIAVVDRTRSLSYGELEQKSNRIARLLIDFHLAREGCVAVMIERSVDVVSALLGTLRAGGHYLPVNADLPYDRIRFMLRDAGCRFLISEKRNIRLLNRLQWDCPQLAYILCLDSQDIHAELEATGEMMKEDVWDYLRRDMFDDISGGGWRSSYTGEWLSREVMDQYGDNIREKLLPNLTEESRVLEIGCASGISMFRLAPHVAYYLGTDISSDVLDWSELQKQKRGLHNIDLRRMAAHEIDQITDGGFDVVIINSVVQCFSGLNYFRSVIRKAIALMADQGIVFFGNLWDQDLKDDFIRSLDAFAKEHGGDKWRTKTDRSEELFVSRTFLEDLRQEYPEIVSVEHSRSLATAASELSDYGFDAIIRIDKSRASLPLKPAESRSKYQWDARTLDCFPSDAVPERAHPDNLAYVMYTSGTTGSPKAVMIEHRSIVRLVVNTNYINLSEEDRILATGSLAFDASTFEIWGALLHGGRLCLPATDTILHARTMRHAIERDGITTMFLTASLLNLLLDSDATVFRGLKTLLAGGEKVSVHHFNTMRRAHPSVALLNGYGPTETTTFAACFRAERTYERDVPIGRPIANTTAFILSKDLLPVPAGAPGELYIGGDGLARGYLNNAALTAERFIPNPFSPGERLYRTGDLCRWLATGDLEYLGRRDNQVKIRGYRIELEEIEAHLLRCEGVNQAAVLAHAFADGNKDLVAYVSARQRSEIDRLREHLKLSLPEYMIPAKFVVLDRLPLNRNGKVDRAGLPDPELEQNEAQSGGQVLRTNAERELARIWEEILNRKVNSFTDNFFELGGHSLRVTKLVSLIEKKLSVAIPLSVVFRFPRLADMATYILESARFGVKEIDDEMVLLSGPDCDGRSVFAFPPGTGDALGYSPLAVHLRPYKLYAFNFVESEARLAQYADSIVLADPSGPYILFGYSSGGNLAYHVARELERRGKEVTDIIMIDSARKLARIPSDEGEIDRTAEAFVNDAAVRPYVNDGILREKALRRVKSSLSYFENSVDSHRIGARIHVLLSEKPIDTYSDASGTVLISTSGWADVTEGRLQMYQGFGEHNHMLHEPHLTQNSATVRRILEAPASDRLRVASGRM